MVGQEVVEWGLCQVFLVHKLVLEVVYQKTGHNACSIVSESLAEADTLATGERDEGVGITLLAGGGQEQWAFRIKAIWEELLRALPLLGVVVHTPNVDLELLTCRHLQITKLGCLSHVIDRSGGGRWVGSERLIEEIGEVVHVSESLVNKSLIKVNFPVDRLVFLEMGLDHAGLDVLKQPLVHLLVSDQVVEHVTDCAFGCLSCSDEKVYQFIDDDDFVFGLGEEFICQQVTEEIFCAKSGLGLTRSSILHKLLNEGSNDARVRLAQTLAGV